MPFEPGVPAPDKPEEKIKTKEELEAMINKMFAETRKEFGMGPLIKGRGQP